MLKVEPNMPLFTIGSLQFTHFRGIYSEEHFGLQLRKGYLVSNVQTATTKNLFSLRLSRT